MHTIRAAASPQVDMFVAMEKVYTGTLRLGEATPSFDAETEVSERQPWQHLTDADLGAARDAFLGDTMQLPPMYSAIRVKGGHVHARADVSIRGTPFPS
jgi:tRNA pseudouridine55 synthase